MFEYRELKRDFGVRVNRTIDSPITILDFWELGDAFSSLIIVLVFGVLFYSFGLMSLLLGFSLIAAPMIRKSNHPGVFFHWPYRNLGITLPGLVNPGGRRKFSD